MARAALGELVANLRLEYGDYIKGIDASARETAKAANSMQSRVDKMAKGISGALTGLVAGFSVAGIVAGVTSVIDKFDRLDAAAQQLGQSSKYIQEMGFVAGQSKSNLEDFTKGFTALSVKIGQARNDNEAVIKQFAAVGISLDDLRKKDAPQIWDMISDAVAGAASETDRMAIAAQFFEKEMGARLIPTLANGSEKTEELRQRFRDLGGVMGDDVIGAAGRLNDQKAQLGVQVEALGNRITAYLIPTLLELATNFNDAQIRGESFADTMAKAVARGVANARESLRQIGSEFRSEKLKKDIDALIDKNKELQKSLEVNGGQDRLFFNADRVRRNIEANRAEADRLSREMMSLSKAPPITAEEMLRDQEFAPGKMETAESRAIKNRIAALKAQSEAAKKAASKPRSAAKTEKPKIDNDIELIRRALESIETPAQKYMKQIAEIQRWHSSGKIDAQDYARLIDGAAKDVGQSLGTWSKYEETQREIANLFEATRTPMERYYTDLAKLNDLLAGGLDYDTYTRALFDLNDQLDDAIATQKTVAEEAESMFDAMALAANNWADQFAETLLSGSQSFADFGKSIINQLAKIAISAALNPIFKGFGEMIGGNGGSLSAAFTGLFGRATGGGVSKNTPYLVGEHGAELFVPQSSGTVHKHGSFGATINQVLNFSGGANAQEITAMVRTATAQARESLLRELSRGGPAARAVGLR